MSSLFALKRFDDSEPAVPDAPVDASLEPPPDPPRRIRCPRCRWQPRATDRWCCLCGHAWNTFDTAGRCPACHYQWDDTACLSCSGWSKHLAWYEPAEPSAR